MSQVLKIWAAEPAILISAVRAVLVCAIGFGLNLTAEQVTGIVVVMESFFALVTRASVYSPGTVAKLKVHRPAEAVTETGDDAG